jgi:hypothetical protein
MSKTILAFFTRRNHSAYRDSSKKSLEDGNMNQPQYQISQNRLAVLEQQLSLQPTNLTLAKQLWQALNFGEGINLQSGDRAIQYFSQAALNSIEGVIELCRALKELCYHTGELPRPEYFEPTLIDRLDSVRLGIRDKEASANITAVLECVRPTNPVPSRLRYCH